MPNIPPAYGIIPARYESTRFPGKPLAEILGRPMFWHVYQRAIQCPLLGKVVVATDDNRIYSEACRYNVPVVMTGREHASGTDRALEAAQMLRLPEDAVILNIQGDEPALGPEMLSELAGALCRPHGHPGHHAGHCKHSRRAEAASPRPGQGRCWTKGRRRRCISPEPRCPFPRDRARGGATTWGHVGLYGFRMRTRKRFALPELAPSPLERREKLEQLRLLRTRRAHPRGA